MSKYKVIFRTDLKKPDKRFPIKWEHGCPLIFEAIQISRDIETGKAFLQAKLRNVCAEEVLSFKAKLVCHFREGDSEEFSIEPLDADLAPGNEYVIKPFELPHGDAVGVEESIFSVSYASGGWDSSSESEDIPKVGLLSLSMEAISERAKELEEAGCKEPATAARYALECHEGWSLCPCGQVNVGTSGCVSCGLDFGVYSSEFEDEGELRRKGVERREREEEERRAREDRKKASRKRVIQVCLPILAFGVMAIAFWYSTVFLPHSNAENDFAEFCRDNVLYEYDEGVDYEEWKEKSAAYQEKLSAFICSSYSALSDDSKLDVLKLLATAQTIDAIYKEEMTNWTVNPSELVIRVALDKVTVKDGVVNDNSFTVYVESRDNASWYDKGKGHNYSSTFRDKYEATFTPNLADGTVDMWVLERTSTDLMGY